MTQTNQKTRQKDAQFADLGISKNFLGVLSDLGFTTPTPIQHQAIPVALKGEDVVGIAQTGTGKTLAFSIPLIQNLAVNKGRGLIIVPTRELAVQVDDELKKIGKPLGLKTAVIIGGVSQHQQVRQLKNNPHIVVGTPGRLNDLIDQKKYSLKDVKGIVLDEADRMLDAGFMPQIRGILNAAPQDRQTLLFSATMPGAISKLAQQYMKSPLRIEVAPAGTSSKNIEQEMFIVKKSEKMQLLDKILGEHDGITLVFSRTKHGAKKIARKVRNMGHTATEIHGNRSQNQRQHALNGFKSGKYRVMVATDIAARGIDIDDIKLVVNYDLPDQNEDYVHRIGRTGRAGNSGKAISFATPDQKRDIKKIERLIKKSISMMQVNDLPAPRVQVKEDRPQRKHGGGRKNYGRNKQRGGSRGGKRGGYKKRSSSKQKSRARA